MTTSDGARRVIAVDDEPLGSPLSLALITRLNAELDVRYPEPGANFFRLDPDEVGPGRGAFVVARVDGAPVGCGAFRVIALDVPGESGEQARARAAEIKRMFVDPAARGHGVGMRILAALEERARALGITRFRLEAGDRQPEALALYGRAGYARIAPFGEYVGAELSVCMGKDDA
jgi:GNAT superfamily N-acetyltransferase